MNYIDPITLEPYAAALGADAIDSLSERRLIRSVGTPVFAPISPALLADRVAGAVAGLTLSDAFAARFRRSRSADGMDLVDAQRWLSDRRSGPGGHHLRASSQMFVMTAEAVLANPYRAARDVADHLARRIESLRSPGNAARHAVDNLRRGAPWFEAAPPSYGNAALPRAVAVGLALHARPDQVGIAASLDTSVSHASRRATEAGAALASTVAAVVSRPEDASLSDAVRRVVASLDDSDIRTALTEMMAGKAKFATHFSPEATASVKLALWCQQFGPELADILHAAATISNGDRATLTIAGAIHGANVGLGRLPDRHLDVEGSQALGVLARRLASGPAATADTPAPTASQSSSQRSSQRSGQSSDVGKADIWFLVDRSGSMSSIAQYVVVGFDSFLTNQRAEAGDATMTVVQFDDKDPHDVLVDAMPIASVPSIGGRFQPRGMTPLFDAVAQLLDRAERHGGDDADQLVVILTDGGENASRNWTHDRIFSRIADLRTRGWTFVFLGANQDSYAAGGQMAMPAGNVSNFRPDESGVAATYTGLDRTVREWRGKGRQQRRRDADDFWGGRKEAEEN